MENIYKEIKKIFHLRPAEHLWMEWEKIDVKSVDFNFDVCIKPVGGCKPEWNVHNQYILA